MQPPVVGARVLQPQYGHGTVTYSNQYHTVIEFDENGKRTFVTDRVELQPSDVAAPVKVKKVARKKAAAAPVVVEAAPVVAEDTPAAVELSPDDAATLPDVPLGRESVE
jgi:hypothetical protein